MTRKQLRIESILILTLLFPNIRVYSIRHVCYFCNISLAGSGLKKCQVLILQAVLALAASWQSVECGDRSLTGLVIDSGDGVTPFNSCGKKILFS